MLGSLLKIDFLSSLFPAAKRCYVISVHPVSSKFIHEKDSPLFPFHSAMSTILQLLGEANSRSLNNKFPVVERIGATHKQKRLCFQLRPYGIVAREFIELLLYARFQHSKLNMFNGIREISDACLSTLSPQWLRNQQKRLNTRSKRSEVLISRR